MFSIVIPCYNHGKYLQAGIDSIQAIENVPYEIIIVDDGSTDAFTRDELMRLKSAGYNVIIQENAGPGAARNNGIRHAKGKYVVPLDADDKIRPEYIYAAKPILDEGSYDIVYANYQCFGGSNEKVTFREFSLQELLLGNCIGSCVVFRKEAWEKVGGYDEHLKKGYSWEDWDMWLSLAKHGFKFKYVDIIGYDYLYHTNSRERSFLSDRHKVNETIGYFERKHKGFFDPAAIHNFMVNQVKKSPGGMLLKIILATFGRRFYDDALRKGKIRKYLS